jgi:hypothetical protein
LPLDQPFFAIGIPRPERIRLAAFSAIMMVGALSEMKMHLGRCSPNRGRV